MADKKISSREARAIRNSSLSDLIASKLMTDESIGSALKLAIDQKIQSHAKGMKEKFNILFIAKVLTGGKIDTKILANILGLDMEENKKGKKVKKEKLSEVNDTNIKSTDQLKQETEEKEKAKRIREGEEESQDVQKTLKVKQTGRATRVRKGDSVSDVLSKIYTILQDSFDKKKLDKELEDDFRQQRKIDDERRHKEFLDALRKAFKGIVEENEKNLKSLANNMGEGGNPIWDFIKGGLEDILLYRLLRNLLTKFPKGLPSIPEVKPPVTEPPITNRLPAPEPTSAPTETKALPAPQTSTPAAGTKALPAPEGTPALPGKGAPVLEPPVNATVNAPRLTPAPTGGTTIEMGKGTTGSYTEVKGFSTVTPRPTGAASTASVIEPIGTVTETATEAASKFSKALGIASVVLLPVMVYLEYKGIKKLAADEKTLIKYAEETGDTKPLRAFYKASAASMRQKLAGQHPEADVGQYAIPGIQDKIDEQYADELVRKATGQITQNREMSKILKGQPISKNPFNLPAAVLSGSTNNVIQNSDSELKLFPSLLNPVEPDFNIGKFIDRRTKENEDMLTAPKSMDSSSTSAVVQNNTSGSTEERTELPPASPVNDESTRSRSVKSSTRKY